MYRSTPLHGTLNTGYIRFGHVWHMYRSSPLRSTLNTGYIRFGHVWHMYRSSPLRSTLNTGYIRFGHVWHMYRSSPLRSTLNTGYIRLGHVWHMYRSSPLRSTLNTGYIRFGHVWHICIPCSISSIERKMMNSSAPLVATWAKTTPQINGFQQYRIVKLWQRKTSICRFGDLMALSLAASRYCGSKSGRSVTVWKNDFESMLFIHPCHVATHEGTFFSERLMRRLQSVSCSRRLEPLENILRFSKRTIINHNFSMMFIYIIKT